MKVLILLTMIFLHITDDYYLQGILASMKQKDWWSKNAPDKLYKYDYLVALFMHSFSWSFMTMFVPVVYLLESNNLNFNIMISIFIFNIALHAFIDNAKANMKKINLVQDQILHLGQIILTWFILIM